MLQKYNYAIITSKRPPSFSWRSASFLFCTTTNQTYTQKSPSGNMEEQQSDMHSNLGSATLYSRATQMREWCNVNLV